MHVCHFSEASVEGAYFKNIAKGLSEKGACVSLLELGAESPPTWLQKVPGVRYFSLGTTKKSQYPLAVWRLARFLRRERVDILQTHLYNAGWISVLAKKFCPETIFVLMRHHTSVVRMLGTKHHVALDKWMAERSDFVITVSEAARKFMRDVDGIRKNVGVVHLGFDFEELASDQAKREKIRREFGFATDDFVIGYVANLAAGKGHLQLVEAFSKIVRSVREARLFLVGSGKSAEVDKAIDEHSLQRQVVFAGWRDDPAACLNAMDLFVQPSLSEAFSQVLIEAMGAGLPVIATDVGGANEVITDGESGFLIAPGEPDVIYEKTLELYRQAVLRKRMAAAGQKKVREEFTVARMVERQFALYEDWMNLKK